MCEKAEGRTDLFSEICLLMGNQNNCYTIKGVKLEMMSTNGIENHWCLKFMFRKGVYHCLCSECAALSCPVPFFLFDTELFRKKKKKFSFGDGRQGDGERLNLIDDVTKLFSHFITLPQQHAPTLY